MIKKAFMALALTSAIATSAQTNVTDKYMENANFQARFANWVNDGLFSYNTAKTFEKRDGEVWLEKWVASGSKLGSNAGIYQQITGLPAGTYTLKAAGKHVNQANASQACTGAWLYAGNEQVEIQAADDYSVTFTLLTGKTNVGVKLVSANGNWFCIDNFRLYSNGLIAENVAKEIDRLTGIATEILTEGANEAEELKAAIEAANAVKTSTSAKEIQAAAKALERATLSYRIANSTGTKPVVKTNPFVAMGTTIALGRATFSGTTSNVIERGFCWSTEPEPTVLDDRSTITISQRNGKGWNGTIYSMEHLKPGTIYYVRAYAMTKTYGVSYGDIVKIATLPKGTCTWSYDNAGPDDDVNFRIKSATQECIWMYNNLSNITNFFLQVHYVQGAGAGGGTADCSYGGWMRVSQNVPYQQTGTILHETNHGVGVGTTGQWYNNANLRANTSSGLWLGPQGTKMVRFFNNDATSTMTGDGTHMWPYGINGAHEDDYQPSNYSLYYANIMITHALHQDGLVSTSSRGFATPAYLFTQDDNAKYYIKTEDSKKGGTTAYLGMTAAGALKNAEMSGEEVMADDNFAWQITYDPTVSYYVFKNIGTGKYLTNASGTIKTVTRSTNKPTATEKFHLMPARNDVKQGKYTGTSYWVLTADGHKALQSGNYTASSATYALSTVNYDASNAATAQRWLFLTADELTTFETGATTTKLTELKTLLSNVNNTLATPHKAKTPAEGQEAIDVATIDDNLEGVIEDIESKMTGFKSPSEVTEAINKLTDALVAFLNDATPEYAGHIFDISYLLVNPGFNTDSEGWSLTATVNNSCAEFFEKSAEINQTTAIKLPIGNYKLNVQAFHRPAALADAYTDWKSQTDPDSIYGSKASIILKTKTAIVKSIFADAQTKTQGTGSKAAATQFYVPDTQQGANNFFKKNFYENEIWASNTTSATIKVGLKSSNTASGSWTCFDNFRLYYAGEMTQEEYTTSVKPIQMAPAGNERIIYDLQGRRVQSINRQGIYIINGKKVMM